MYQKFESITFSLLDLDPFESCLIYIKNLKGKINYRI